MRQSNVFCGTADSITIILFCLLRIFLLTRLLGVLVVNPNQGTDVHCQQNVDPTGCLFCYSQVRQSMADGVC